MAKKRRTINTRRMAHGLNAGALLRLLLIFFVLDSIIAAFDIYPAVIGFFPGGKITAAQAEAVRPQLEAAVIKVLSQELLMLKYSAIGAAETVFLFFRVVFGAGYIRKRLRPVDDLADVAFEWAQRSSETSGIADEERFRRLEDAIDNISPAMEDAGLNTGDKELEGLELAVNNLIERMRDSYRQQARFVSDASHELRTPIAVIKGYAEMLDRWGKTDEKVLEESIEAIKSESEHMNYLVEQLLFLARGDSGRTKMEFGEFDLSAMIREVYEESVMIDPAHTYKLQAGKPVTVYGDSSMLKQTARILMDNAKKYTPENNEIRIGAGYSEGVPCFEIQDSGVGISSEALPHVFERFFRADSSRARETGGTGLGLAIAKWIVDKHGGSFSVLSREGIGTRITVLLPQPGSVK